MIGRLRESAVFYSTALTFASANATWLLVVQIGAVSLPVGFIGFAVVTLCVLLFAMRFEQARMLREQARDQLALARELTAVRAELTAVRAELTAVRADLTKCREEGQETHKLVNGNHGDLVERIAQLTKALTDAGEPVPRDRTGDDPAEGSAA